jgi:photosystem II stability/assembly factor-like uncharacterized protein
MSRSSDDGRSWAAVAGLPEGMETLSLAADSHGLVYAGTLAAGVFRSRDGGLHWEATLGLEGQQVRAVGFDGLGRPHTAAIGMNGGVFRSDDGGLH